MVYPEALADAIAKVQDTILVCPPVISQVAAVAAMAAGPAYTRGYMPALTEVRGIVSAELRSLEPLCTVPPADGAFYCFLRVNAEADPMTVAERLVREHRVAVIPGPAFGMRDGCYFRRLRRSPEGHRGRGNRAAGAWLAGSGHLNVELLRFVGSFHDEAEACRCVLAHQLVDHPVGDDLIGHLDAKQTTGPRVQRRLPQHFGHHLAEPFESGDLRRAATVLLLEDCVLLILIECPVRVLPDVDAIERRLREDRPCRWR